ncbi:MAG TPA: TonB-dependent receptor [Acidisarcina sp.]
MSGTAEDVSGAVIPKATIVLKNEASGDVRTTTSDSSGYFSLNAVPPASYTITVSAAGFTTWQERNIVMGQGDQRSVANIKLKVGGKTTEIEVVSDADAVVPVDTSEISTTLNTEMIQDITIAGRDAGELLKIMPGMALTNGLNQGSSFNGKVTGTNNGPVGAYSSNGTQPNGAMAFMLDGANLIDPGNAGTQIANINQDMTAEVKVLMSGYGAEYAKGPVIFEAFSKSGGSQFHGEGYIYAKQSAFNTWDAFAKNQYVAGIAAAKANSDPTKLKNALAQANTLKPDEHYYYMGGNVGGPVLIPFTGFNKSRKRLFFWAGYEYMDQHPAATPIDFNVPTVAQKSGNFLTTGVPGGVLSSGYSYAYTSACNNLPAGDICTKDSAGNIIANSVDPTTFDPNLKGLLAEGAYPDPNITPNANNGWGNYQYVSAVPQNRWEATGKIDYAVSDNTKVTGSYTRQIENDSHPIAIWWAPPWTLPYPSNVVAATTSQEVMTNFTHVFNPTTTNEFVYTLARYINPSTLSNELRVDRAKLGFNVTGLFGHTSKQIPNISGPWGGALPNLAEYPFDGTFNGGAFGALKKDPAVYDNFSKVLGSHTLKAGVYWDTNENIQSNSSPDNGNYNIGWGQYGTGNVVADFLLGRPASGGTAGYQQQSTIPVDDIKYHQWSLFAQDSWKAGNQLTINYGIRFDHMGQWTVANNKGMQVFDQATYVNVAPNIAPVNTGLLWHAIDKGIPTSGWKSPLFYLEPRVGIAYDVFGTGKTVIRGGVAVFRYQVSVNDVGGAVGGPEGSFGYNVNIGFEGYGPGAALDSNYVKATGITTGGFLPALAAAKAVVPTTSSQNGANISALQMGDDRTPSTLDWNVTVSQATPWRSVFEVSYVANKSSNELISGGNSGLNNINNVNPGALFRPDPITGQIGSPSAPPCGGPNGSIYCAANPIPYANFNQNDYRPLLGYQDIYIVTHGSYANYNSLQTSWQKQSGPVTFLLNYTFSKLLGIRDGQTNNGAGNGAAVDPFNIKANYGPLAYDHTNIFNAAYVWNMPSPIHGNKLAAGVVNGWQLSGYTTFQSGANLQANIVGLNAQFPGNLSVPTVSNPALPDNSIALPNGLRSVSVNQATWFGTGVIRTLLPTLTCNPAAHLKSGQYFNPACFGVPAYGQQGATEWPYMRGPAYFNSDLAMFKNFRVTDNQKLQFRVSATNFLNHPLGQFGRASSSDEQLSFIGVDSGGNQFLSPTNVNPSTTGKPLNKVGNRVVTFALKYYF